ncbi:hypothetical protein DM860_000594 [Cuscuta australis]|uniref:Eukaryotic translation initiation factor 3 subunit I n=1 Tax=Cuscuta australis TaxID=267555 RepID=A0A328CYZ8_9ASTE|nr:hypothetical protein DM860_000594 [Cuscuta australis]
MAFLAFATMIVLAILEIPAAANPLFERYSGCREELAAIGGYGEEKLSTVIIYGTVLCHPCGGGRRHPHMLRLKPHPISASHHLLNPPASLPSCAQMRPILMKGHERPLTFLKYNREGDLLFSCAKDHNPTVWFADNGERLGTYRGHNGAVWSCDVSRDSTTVITASADQTSKLWDVKTGTPLFTFQFDSPCRSVDFSIGDKLAVITTDQFLDIPSAIHVKRISIDPEDDIDEQSDESVVTIKGVSVGRRINRAVWGPLNRTIISGGDDAVLRIWDAETGKLLKESDKESGHTKGITSLVKSADGSHFITGSLDKSAKLWDIRNLTLLKTYASNSLVNAVDMSPLVDHIVLGGGQEARDVPKSDGGKFEAKFYDKILEEEIGGVKGHFGPINALAFNPDGKSFASGGEDGYVRLHHFDSDYFHIRI